jgi:small-conductance mechanosensitive channel
MTPLHVFEHSSLYHVLINLVPLLIVAGMGLVGLIAEQIVLRYLARLAVRTTWLGDTKLIAALRGKLVLWGALFGVSLALPHLPWALDNGKLGLLHNGMAVLFVLSLTHLAAQVAAELISRATRPDTRPALSIVTNVVRVAIYLLGLLIILHICSVEITPALAALGVGGLAVSLALQSTLTDLFSALQMIAARQIKPGDYIRLSTGEEGYVTDISWRTTCVRQLANNLIIIPNAKMTSTIVTNYHAPNPNLAVLIDLSVSYDCDLDHVEHVTLEVARAVMREVSGGVAESEPLLRYVDFGDSSIQFRLILNAREYADQFLLKHELIKRLHRSYMEEGIDIPIPMRSIQLRNPETLVALALPTAREGANDGAR